MHKTAGNNESHRNQVKKLLQLSADLVSRTGMWCVRHYHWALTGILLLGLGLRIVRYYRSLFQARDGYAYIQAAKIVTEQGWANFFQVPAFSNMPPGFLWLLLCGRGCGLELEITGIIWVLLFGALLIWAAYWCVYGLYHRIGFALLAALAIATDSNLIRLGASSLRETPYYACVLTAIGAGIWAIRKQQLRYWLIFIPVAASAILIRKEGFEVLMIPMFWSAISLPGQLWKRDWARIRFTIGSTLLVESAVLLLLLPIQFYYMIEYQSQWEVIPQTWAGFIWSMFYTQLKS